jgi:hypothetical protein
MDTFIHLASSVLRPHPPTALLRATYTDGRPARAAWLRIRLLLSTSPHPRCCSRRLVVTLVLGVVVKSKFGPCWDWLEGNEGKKRDALL